MLDLFIVPIAKAIATHLDLPEDKVTPLVTPPTRANAGDLALPCFVFAKERKMAPPALAGELAQVVNALDGVSAQAAGPFLNMTLEPALVALTMHRALLENPVAMLRSESGAGKKVCVDFSSPNIAKHLAFHHIRSTMIGNALAHCYGAAGWDVTRINFLGDWGTAFGRLIAGWKREGHDLQALNAADDKVTFLNELYVRISQAAKADESVMDEARSWSKKLEDGDAEARELWQVFKDASLTEFEKVYGMLGVGFDSWKGEAYYEDKMQPMLDELETKGLLSVDDGAQVVDLSEEGFKKPVLIRRADGGTLYATRDLTACEDRYQEFGFDRSLYVVDLGQGLHFREWFAVAKKLGKPYAENLRHVGFGVVLMWNEEGGDDLKGAWAKTATRNGVPMLLVDVLKEAVSRARAIIEEKNPELPDEEKAAVASAVGTGAVVFNDLKNGRTGDVKFRFDDALNMQGETGPYLQFAHARLRSIQRKFAEAHPDAVAGDPSLLGREDEKAVLLSVARLRGALDRAVADDEPSTLAQGLLSLASAVSSWLTAGNNDHGARVLCDDTALSAARVGLVGIAATALEEGLRLLGLGAPQRM